MVASILTTTPPTGTGSVVFSATDITIPAISGYVPKLGDLLILFGDQENQAANVMTTADWAAAGATVVTAANIGFTRGHWITPAEVVAGTNAWTLSGQFDANGQGRGIVAVVRGAGSVVVATTQGVGTAAAPAAVTPAVEGSVILAHVACDNRSMSVTDPGAGWSTLQKSSSVTNVPSQILMRRTALAPGGVAVNMTNAAVTLGSSDEWAAITVALDHPADSGGGVFACL